MAIQKKTEGRDLDEYLQEVWDSLEPAWDKSKFDMKQGYDSEYECDCITITSKDNEGVRAKIYVNDYEGRHPVGFDVVYRYPGDKGVGVMGSYEFQSTDMDSLGEEVFDYFDEIKKKAAGASFESDLQAYADAVKADKYDKQSVVDDGWEFDNSVEYDEDIVRDDFKKKYDGKTYLLHITFNPSTKDVSDVKWDISAVESKKTEDAGSFKVGDLVNYDAESDGKDVYDSFIPCEVVDVNDDGTLGLCVYGSYADEEGLGENASASCCSKLDHYAGMVDANTYYTDGKYKAYKGGWEILVTEKELDPSVYEFIGSMDDLSEVVDFDDYYGGENFVYDEDLRDALGATGVDTDGVDFADMSGDVAKASGNSEESKKSTVQEKGNKDIYTLDLTRIDGDGNEEGLDDMQAAQSFYDEDEAITAAKELADSYKDDEDVVQVTVMAGEQEKPNGDIVGEPFDIFTASSSDSETTAKYREKAGYTKTDGLDYYAKGGKSESKKSEGLPPKKLGDRRYRSRADLINKMKILGATEITTRDQYDEICSKQWLHKGGYAMDINGNLVGQTYYGDKDGKWYYASSKTFQGDYLPECKKSESKADGERAVDDYDTLTDGLESCGFELSSAVRDGKFYPYRTRFTATKNGVKYGFTLNEDSTGEYLESIEVGGGIFDKGDPNDPDPTKFNSVGDLLDALKKMDGKESESKKSESLTLKQKELKDMVRFGQAEDITTISDEEAKALRKKGIETVGVSRGTYGMNGALLRDSEGKKYVITARSSNLFYFV